MVTQISNTSISTVRSLEQAAVNSPAVSPRENNTGDQATGDTVSISQEARSLQRTYEEKENRLEEKYASEADQLERDFQQEKAQLQQEYNQKKQSLGISLVV